MVGMGDTSCVHEYVEHNFESELCQAFSGYSSVDLLFFFIVTPRRGMWQGNMENATSFVFILAFPWKMWYTV